MKKILIIAHQFPPMGGSGVQRTSKFVKYLISYNWETTILTCKTKNMELIDESLLEDVKSASKIVRTNAYDLTNLKGIFKIPGKIISRKILIPDAEFIWQLTSRKKALNLLKTTNFDALYTTSYPYSDHLLGLYLKKKYPKLKWIVDFRDEWTNNPYLLDNPFNPLRMKIEKYLEKKILINSDQIITNTPIMCENFIKNNIDITNIKDKIHVIPNGFDSDDFISFTNKKSKNTKFTLTYTGVLYGRRKPDTFLQAVGELIEENKINPDEILIKFIGNIRESTLEKPLNLYKLHNIVKLYPYMKHSEVVKVLNLSDCLVLIEGSGPGAEAFFTGKIFEYMNAKQPILAVIPENGVAANLIKKSNTGLVSDFFDVNLTKKNLLTLYNNWKSNTSILDPNWEIINFYERKNLTKELVKILER